MRECVTLSALAALALTVVSAPAAAQQFDWKKHSGRTVNVALAKQPWSDFITPLIPEFEQKTSIKARIEDLPKEQNCQKHAIAFTANRGDIDVFGGQRHNEGAKYHKASWYEPLKPLIDNKSLTSPEFDFPDFAPQ